MTLLLLAITIGLAVAALGVVCYIEGHTKGLSQGYHKGYDNGLKDGYDASIEKPKDPA